MTERLRLVVDAERCIGSGTCELLAPEVFVVDEDTAVAAVLGDGRLPADRAAEVVDRCPSGAIAVADDTGWRPGR